MNKQCILIIEDEQQIRKLLRINFENNDFKVIEASTGKDGINFAASHLPDLIILDIGLPDKSGQIILKELREWFNKPIIILSVLNNETDIVSALDNGATDYLTKPFRVGELLARIRSALRNNIQKENETFGIFDDLEIDYLARTVKKNNVFLKLTATEYNLMALLTKNEGKVLTHQYLLREIWGGSYREETQYLRVFIASLRKKIEENPDKPIHIITESRVGYRFQ